MARGPIRGRTLIRGSWLFDGTGPALIAEPAVLVAGGRIVDVRAGRSPADDEPQPGTTVVDLPGCTLLPGLVDTHVHLAFDAGPDPVGALAGRSDEAVVAAMISAGRDALRGGVTTVRDLGDRDFLSLRLRGRDDLPTILASGPPITTRRGHCHYLGGGIEATEAAMRRAVAEHAERGVDVIKVMASGGTLTPGTHQHLPQFDAPVLRAAVDEAHHWGLPLTAHAHAVAAVLDAVGAGADGVEHCSFWTEDGVAVASDDQLEELKRSGVVVGATLGMVPVTGAQPPPEVLRRMPGLMANLRRMREREIPMVAGTDAGIGVVKPHHVLQTVPEVLCALGFAPASALALITSVAAGVLGLGDRKGRIAPGYDADLLAVDGDPLTDPAALTRVREVYRSGRRCA